MALSLTVKRVNVTLRLTLPPVLSASLPMPASQQSVPSNVITDMATLREQRHLILIVTETH